jgi:S-DNA-T family DNA segregation ATPase FtsK/SpoIIIE
MTTKRNTTKRVTKKKQQELDHNSLIINIVISIVMFMLLIMAVLQEGSVGMILSTVFRYILGEFYIICFISYLVVLMIKIFAKDKKTLTWNNYVGIILLNFAILLIFSIPDTNIIGFKVLTNFLDQTKLIFSDMSVSCYGGLVGTLLYSFSSLMFAKNGTFILIAAMIIISVVMMVPLKVYESILNQDKSKKIIKPKKNKVGNVKINDSNNDNTGKFNILADSKNKNNNVKEIKGNSNKKTVKKINKIDIGEEVKESEVTSVVVVDNKNYRLPPFSLLEPIDVNPNSDKNKEEMQIRGQRIVDILENFGIDSQLMAIHIGPSVTKFEIKPDSGVKVSKIYNLQDNIKMELAASDVRIEAPIPGKNAVGIEVPNVHVSMVKMLEVIRRLPQDKRDKKLLFVLGKDLMGESVFCELNKMPHLLIAGATGSGKSICINTIITSFLLRTTPDEVKLLLIDPKKVEFMPYREVPHLIGPVISDANEASRALKAIVIMMEERFDVFSKVGVKNITTFNNLVKQTKDPKLKAMPFIVVIIDELADLMMVAGKEVEGSIQRITQLARASGIHLIVATQRPSTDVITGIIKSNIPSRISFSVASGIDSRTILDQVGAERLLGAGDMLYSPSNLPSPIRIQGVYVSDEEVKTICDFVSKQAKPRYEDVFIRLEGVEDNESTGIVKAEDDPLFLEVKTFVIDAQKASTSLLQRHFGIGYNRAARMIDVLESRGVIGPQKGSKPRDVYIQKEDFDNE